MEAVLRQRRECESDAPSNVMPRLTNTDRANARGIRE